MLPHRTIILASLAILVAPLTAQPFSKILVTPAGHQYASGNTNNNFPFSGLSSRYQQIHDAADLMTLTGGAAMLLDGIGFRPSATFPVAARQWDLQLTLGTTPTTAATMTATFSSNLGASPTVVLPYTIVSVPGGQGVGSTVPNALLWRIPFKSFFIYDSNQGNLCWQWQHRNATTGSSPMDAVSSSFQGINAVAPNSGMGCTATGMSTASSTNFQIAAGNVSVALANGAPTASSILWLGLNRIEVNLGWCTPLYVNPIVQVGGSTNATGAWQAGVAPIAVLALPNYFELHAQFAYLDAGLTGGIGLSDLGTVTGIPHGGRYSARLYSQNNGENAVTGSKTSGFGVITTFSRL